LQEGHENRTLFEPTEFLKMMCMLGAFEVGHDAQGRPLTPPPCEEEQ